MKLAHPPSTIGCPFCDGLLGPAPDDEEVLCLGCGKTTSLPTIAEFLMPGYTLSWETGEPPGPATLRLAWVRELSID